MSDRFLRLLTAAALAAALSTDALAQGAMRAGQGPGGFNNRNELAEPPMGVPMSVQPGLPVERPSTLIDPNRRLQQGDELAFKIDEDKDQQISLQVSHTGEVVVEPLEQAVKVAGMTTRQAASEIKRLLEKDYYHRATVRLSLVRANLEANRSSVYIWGEVQRIGQIAMYEQRPLKLSEAILQAGGFQRYADDRKVKVSRKDGTQLVVDMKKVMKEMRAGDDLTLQDGDRIFVPQIWGKF